MDQNKIVEILNRHVFNEDKVALLQAVAENPDRFVGLFRSTTPRLKLLQNLLQSREIRFGDAMEEVITLFLEEMGFINLDKRFLTAEDDTLACDQYFCLDNRSQFYLMEQKVRDDHDSAKKRGQITNFDKKLRHLYTQHGNTLIGIMYFIDPSLHKNRNYYEKELESLSQTLKIPIHLFYNGELFQYFQGNTGMWNVLRESLQMWRRSVPEQINLDYDADPTKTLTDLALISGGIWHKLISNETLWEGGVIQTLFPTGKCLQMLYREFQFKGYTKYRWGRGSSTYDELALMLKNRLASYYPST